MLKYIRRGTIKSHSTERKESENIDNQNFTVKMHGIHYTGVIGNFKTVRVDLTKTD